MNGMTFPHKKSSRINFLTVDNCTSKSAYNAIKELNTVNNMYNVRGFNIDVLHRDNKFNLNALREHIRPESLNICAKGRHTPIIDRPIKKSRKESAATHILCPTTRDT